MAETADTQRLIALVEANTKSFERAMNRLEGVTKKSMAGVQREVSKIDAALKSAGAAATTFLRGFAVGAIAAGITGLAAMAKNAIATAAALNDVSENTGIAASELQKLAIAAEQSGGNAETLLNSFRKFNVEIGEARNKGGELAEILKANGIALDQDNLQIWRQVVDLIANAKDETDAAYLAQLAMGRAASENLNFFRQGSESIRLIGQQAEQSGAIIDDELVKKADEFADRWSLAMRTVGSDIATWTIKSAGFIETMMQKIDAYWRSTALGQLSTRNEPMIMGGGAGSAAADLLRATTSAKPTIIPPKKTDTTTDPAFGNYDLVTAKLKKVQTVAEQLTKTITDGFDNMGSTLLGVARGAEALDKALQRTLDNILNKLADQAFQQLIAAIVGGLGPKVALPGVGPGGMGFTTFGGPRQSGGAVARGKSYLVGERGPELFSPNMSGYVMPRGRGGGGNTQVHIHTPPGMIAETKQDKTANGTRVDVLIREAVRKELPGVMKPMLRDQYGVTPVARKRF